MYIVERSLRFVRGFLLSYGPSNLKKRVWDKEYADNKWHFADNTANDCVYSHLEKFAHGGSILDLGCGSGNTCCEMKAEAYSSYTGVDISQEALMKAAKRSELNGRAAKHSFACSDFLSFQPTGNYDVVLFRESMYHIPISQIKPLLDKYAQYLKDDGVFIVRLFVSDLQTHEPKHRPRKMIETIEANFDVIEKGEYPQVDAEVIVFRPKKRMIN